MACTTLQGPHPHLRATVSHFLPTPQMCRREPPCAVAPNLCPAESKCKSNSFCCALPCAAAIRPPAVALLASPHAGAIRVLFTRLGPPMALPSKHVRLMYVSNEKKQNLFAGGASGRRAGDAPRRSRLRTAHNFVENGALATARCSFSLLARS